MPNLPCSFSLFPFLLLSFSRSPYEAPADSGCIHPYINHSPYSIGYMVHGKYWFSPLPHCWRTLGFCETEKRKNTNQTKNTLTIVLSKSNNNQVFLCYVTDEHSPKRHIFWGLLPSVWTFSVDIVSKLEKKNPVEKGLGSGSRMSYKEGDGSNCLTGRLWLVITNSGNRRKFC